MSTSGGVTEADFRALARSSPWLWDTISFTASWTGPHAGGPVRAWIERPNRMRVEDLAGKVLKETDADPRPATTMFTSDSSGWSPVPAPGLAPHSAPVASPPPPTEPRRRSDGLVAERLGYLFDHDAPMYQNYHWVAMLDPRELTDGADLDAVELDERDPDGTSMETVRTVDHHGRSAWEAVLRPTRFYDPRCSCCALLNCAEAAEEYLRPDEPRQVGGYATWFLVRLDVGTGICVSTQELDGPHAGAGHEVRIETVDAPVRARPGR
ncbi:hypothetical protein [Ruania zhangjianzhongii]|uniref:hypothetical protein n=1 Tax=Ruania zhangjianzhongii TaxID=2603206 RepID=UPI0011C94E60|nr:hypothetical protein [Ruania zhangjianzhongii]